MSYIMFLENIAHLGIIDFLPCILQQELTSFVSITCIWYMLITRLVLSFDSPKGSRIYWVGLLHKVASWRLDFASEMCSGIRCKWCKGCSWNQCVPFQEVLEVNVPLSDVLTLTLPGLSDKLSITILLNQGSNYWKGWSSPNIEITMKFTIK